MGAGDIAEALQRVAVVLRRHPQTGIHDDAPAVARWEKGSTRMVASHANGTQLETDMPAELGGAGDRVTPGWLFRAGLASCAATSIALMAASEGIALDSLDVRASSRSDTRGLLGIADASGQPVHAGPGDLRLQVRISAAGVPAQRLRAMVEAAYRRSPVPCALQGGTAVELCIEIDGE